MSDITIYNNRRRSIYLVILLLGEGIERAIDADNRSDEHSTTDRLFFSMDDIRYYEKNDKIDVIARGIVDRLLSTRLSAGDSAVSAPTSSRKFYNVNPKRQ